MAPAWPPRGYINEYKLGKSYPAMDTRYNTQQSYSQSQSANAFAHFGSTKSGRTYEPASPEKYYQIGHKAYTPRAYERTGVMALDMTDCSPDRNNNLYAGRTLSKSVSFSNPVSNGASLNGYHIQRYNGDQYDLYKVTTTERLRPALRVGRINNANGLSSSKSLVFLGQSAVSTITACSL